MFHHLDPDVKTAALAEARRVLTPDGAMQLVDFGGAVDETDGFAARLQHRQQRLADNLGDRIPGLMRDAGFTDAVEVAHQVSRLGRITHYRGVAGG